MAGAVDDPDQTISSAAAKGLRLIDTRPAREALRKHSDHPDVHVRWEIYLALCDPDERPIDPPQRVYDYNRPSTWFHMDELVGG